jgi:hypothetical protein
MEYTIKLTDRAITCYVTIKDKGIVSIDILSIVYTPDSPYWQQVKRYAESLMIEQIKL